MSEQITGLHCLMTEDWSLSNSYGRFMESEKAVVNNDDSRLQCVKRTSSILYGRVRLYN